MNEGAPDPEDERAPTGPDPDEESLPIKVDTDEESLPANVVPDEESLPANVVPDEESLSTRPGPEDQSPRLAARIVVSHDGPAKCTIYPSSATGAELLSTWITAEEGSFRSLEDMR